MIFYSCSVFKQFLVCFRKHQQVDAIKAYQEIVFSLYNHFVGLFSKILIFQWAWLYMQSCEERKVKPRLF